MKALAIGCKIARVCVPNRGPLSQGKCGMASYEYYAYSMHCSGERCVAPAMTQRQASTASMSIPCARNVTACIFRLRVELTCEIGYSTVLNKSRCNKNKSHGQPAIDQVLCLVRRQML
jgi:hypothetical protein